MTQLLKDILQKFISFLSSKFLTNVYIVRFKEILKSFINSIRIPNFLSFFILKSGKINPTIDETLAEAPPAENNWNRLGLDKEIIAGLPTWTLFFLISLIVFLNFWSDIAKNMLTTFTQFMLSTFSFPSGMALPFKYGMDGIIYLIDFLSRFGALVPLAIIFYFLIKSWGKK